MVETVIGSARSQYEAVKDAERYLAEQEEETNIIIRPKQFNFSSVGMDENHAAAVVGDKEFFKMINKLEKENDMTLAEARELTQSLVKKKGRHRFLGNMLKRKGVAGYEKDMQWVLRHFVNTASRYAAMETEFKPKAISLYERTYGRFDDDPQTLRDRRTEARYVKDYIMDINGNPPWLEEATSRFLQHIPFLGRKMKSAFGDRYALHITNQFTSLTAMAKLGVLNVSSALLNLSQFLNASALIGNPIPLLRAAGRLIGRGSRLGRGISRKGRLSESDRRVLIETGVMDDLGLDSGSGYSKMYIHFPTWGETKAGVQGGLSSLGRGSVNLVKGSVNLVKHPLSIPGKLGTGTWWLLEKLKTVGGWGMGLFRATEQLVRRATVLAAYEKGKKLGKSHKEAIQYAKEVNQKANFEYGVQDAPNVFRRGSVFSQLLLQFKKYGVKQLELMGEMIWGKDLSITQKLFGFWLPYIVLCGLWQMPFTGVVEDLLKLFFGDKVSLELAYKKWVYEKADEQPEWKLFADWSTKGF